MFSILASGCVQGPWAGARCSKCCQRRIWEQASDWLNSFVTEEKKRKRGETLAQLGFASNGLMNPLSFTLYISLWDVYDTVLIKKNFKSVLNLLSADLPDSRGICAVGEPNCVIEKWWPNLYLISQASCMTVHVPLGSAHTVCGSQLMRGSQPFWRLDTTHFYCPFLVCCA